MTPEDLKLKSLLNNCRVVLEQRYHGKIEGDEYFKRGFLLGTKEITEELFNALKDYTITKKENNNELR
jgi:hypothetical protein